MNDLFSERYGYVVKELQFESLNTRVRNHVWDKLNFYFFIPASKMYTDPTAAHEPFSAGLKKLAKSFYNEIHKDFFGQSIYTFPSNPDSVIHSIYSSIHNKTWYEVFDVIEAIVRYWKVLEPNEEDRNKRINRFAKDINGIFETEKCQYRLMDGLIIPITNNVEIMTIANALTDSKSVQTVNTHLVQAVKLYANRENPDYRNAIKEAIYALESLLNLIVGTPSGTMRDALKLIKRNSTIELHSALRESLNKLYGWAGDESGVKHHLKEEVMFNEVCHFFRPSKTA